MRCRVCNMQLDGRFFTTDAAGRTYCKDHSCRSDLAKQGFKLDRKKPRWDLLPMEPLEKVVRVLTHSLKTYPENNWQRIDDIPNRYYAACLRHLAAWRKGARRDKRSGQSHLAHAICCLLFILWKELTNAKKKNNIGH